MIKLLKNTKKIINGKTYYRIKATKSFNVQCTPIYKDSIGGYVDNINNITKSWIDKDSIVTSSEIINSIIINSTVIESKIINSEIKYSTIEKSKIADSFISITNTKSSQLFNSSIEDTTIYLAQINDSTVLKSKIEFIPLVKCNIVECNISYGFYENISICKTSLKALSKKAIELALKVLFDENNEVVLCKWIAADRYSYYYPDFKYKLGMVEAKEYDENPHHFCSAGLHATSMSYIDEFNHYGPLLVKIKVKLEDILALGGHKVRFKKGKVISIEKINK